jgi:hypothetical protein
MQRYAKKAAKAFRKAFRLLSGCFCACVEDILQVNPFDP